MTISIPIEKYLKNLKKVYAYAILTTVKIFNKEKIMSDCRMEWTEKMQKDSTTLNIPYHSIDQYKRSGWTIQ